MSNKTFVSYLFKQAPTFQCLQGAQQYQFSCLLQGYLAVSSIQNCNIGTLQHKYQDNRTKKQSAHVKVDVFCR